MATQYAHLFGFDCKSGSPGESPELASAKPDETMIALSYRTLRLLSRDQSVRLRNLVAAGAVLFIRGGFHGKERCSLAPLLDVTFSYVTYREASAYRVGARWPMPEVLHAETSHGEFLLPSARGIPEQAQILASARYEYGEWAPFLFAIQCGKGTVICDLLADTSIGSPDTPIVFRLTNPSKRYAELGPLCSSRLAASISPAARPSLNVILDDRPANFDYLNTGNLRRWLQHVESQFPGAHVDFAWTPDQLYPARSYIETLKRFNTGFVWHGFKHHVNHSKSLKLADDLREGAQMVARITRQFEVRFQPVMVFPYEAFGLETLPFLKEGGFLATYGSPLASPGLWSPFPSFMHRSIPLHEQVADVFPVLRRHSCGSLTWDLMLSHAALNLPIVVVVHPDELGLRRWPYPPLPQGTLTHCDSVLSFAAAKGLEAHSLEEIAQDIVGRPRPKVLEPAESGRINARQIH